jgi:hypothetical protein
MIMHTLFKISLALLGLLLISPSAEAQIWRYRYYSSFGYRPFFGTTAFGLSPTVYGGVSAPYYPAYYHAGPAYAAPAVYYTAPAYAPAPPTGGCAGGPAANYVAPAYYAVPTYYTAPAYYVAPAYYAAPSAYTYAPSTGGCTGGTAGTRTNAEQILQNINTTLAKINTSLGNINTTVSGIEKRIGATKAPGGEGRLDRPNVPAGRNSSENAAALIRKWQSQIRDIDVSATLREWQKQAPRENTAALVRRWQAESAEERKKLAERPIRQAFRGEIDPASRAPTVSRIP